MVKERVLVIDDNEVTSETLKMILEKEGFAVNNCSGWRSAFYLAQIKSFDIFVIDYSMPEMRGDAVTAEVRKMNPGSFIIGYSMEPKEIAFLNAGADKFIIKDHLMKELIQSLKDRNHHISGRKKFTV